MKDYSASMQKIISGDLPRTIKMKDGKICHTCNGREATMKGFTDGPVVILSRGAYERLVELAQFGEMAGIA